MSLQGYVRFPHVFQDHIVFVADDDLWVASCEGGRADRLTAGVGEFSPLFSRWAMVGFCGQRRGTERGVCHACYW
jgi:tricorn protease